MSVTPIEASLRRDRLAVLSGLTLITLLAWAYLVYLAWDMQHMDMGMDMDMAMPRMQAWGAVEYLLMFLMWTVMMAAMMIPSAAPMILMFAGVNRKGASRIGLTCRRQFFWRAI